MVVRRYINFGGGALFHIIYNMRERKHKQCTVHLFISRFILFKLQLFLSIVS